jgi:hypothetical protein
LRYATQQDRLEFQKMLGEILEQLRVTLEQWIPLTDNGLKETKEEIDRKKALIEQIMASDAALQKAQVSLLEAEIAGKVDHAPKLTKALLESYEVKVVALQQAANEVLRLIAECKERRAEIFRLFQIEVRGRNEIEVLQESIEGDEESLQENQDKQKKTLRRVELVEQYQRELGNKTYFLTLRAATYQEIESIIQKLESSPKGTSGALFHFHERLKGLTAEKFQIPRYALISAEEVKILIELTILEPWILSEIS